MEIVARDVMIGEPAVCAGDALLDQVAKVMLQRDCRAIIVVDLFERPLGILTERDIMRRVVAEGRNPLAYPVDMCMSRPVVTVPRDAPLDQVIATMESHRIRRVPVVDGEGRCVGIITDDDVIAAWRRIRFSQPGVKAHDSIG